MTSRRTFLHGTPLVMTAALPGLACAAAASDAVTLPTGARVPKFEFVYECDATLEDRKSVV